MPGVLLGHITGSRPLRAIASRFVLAMYAASKMAWLLPQGMRSCISRNTGESCAWPAVTSHVAITPCGAIGMCSLLNSRLDMFPLLASPQFSYLIMENPNESPRGARSSITASIMPARLLVQ